MVWMGLIQSVQGLKGEGPRSPGVEGILSPVHLQTPDYNISSCWNCQPAHLPYKFQNCRSHDSVN